MTLILAMAILLPPYSSAVEAFEDDLHYHVKFKIADADSWDWDEARVIASADQAVDLNEATVAELIFSNGENYIAINPLNIDFSNVCGALYGNFSNYSSVTPAQRNYDLHAFSHTADRTECEDQDKPENIKKEPRNPDVLNQLGKLEDRTIALIDAAKASGNPADKTNALIAIGVYLHAQEDSWSHCGFGGSNSGHAFEFKNTDHPAQRPNKTRRALEETRQKLSLFMDRLKGSLTDVTESEVSALAGSITNQKLLQMSAGLRKDCVKQFAEYWLWATLKNKLGKDGKKPKLDDPKKAPPGTVKDFHPSTTHNPVIIPSTLFGRIAIGHGVTRGSSCADVAAAPLAPDAQIVEDPDGVFPKLTPHTDAHGVIDGADPVNVKTNDKGEVTYDEVAARFDYVVDQAMVRQEDLPGETAGCRYEVAAQVTNMGPETAPAAELALFVESGIPGVTPGISRVPIGPLEIWAVDSYTTSVTLAIPCGAADPAVLVAVQPDPELVAMASWDDADLSNDFRIELASGDTTPPDLVCPADVTVPADSGRCDARVDLGEGLANDACGIANAQISGPEDGVFPVGRSTVTWQVADGEGNTATCTQHVTVTDSSPDQRCGQSPQCPVIATPAFGQSVASPDVPVKIDTSVITPNPATVLIEVSGGEVEGLTQNGSVWIGTWHGFAEGENTFTVTITDQVTGATYVMSHPVYVHVSAPSAADLWQSYCSQYSALLPACNP